MKKSSRIYYLARQKIPNGQDKQRVNDKEKPSFPE